MLQLMAVLCTSSPKLIFQTQLKIYFGNEIYPEDFSQNYNPYKKKIW
jgi:hypothetical protein